MKRLILNVVSAHEKTNLTLDKWWATCWCSILLGNMWTAAESILCLRNSGKHLKFLGGQHMLLNHHSRWHRRTAQKRNYLFQLNRRHWFWRRKWLCLNVSAGYRCNTCGLCRFQVFLYSCNWLMVMVCKKLGVVFS